MQLTIKNLSKTYPNGVQALNDVSLTIQQGMFGLLGPNGAGKSSLMRTIATLQEADSGSIQLGPSTGSGQAINVLTQKDEVRKTLGYLPQEFGVYPKVDAETLLDHLAVLKGITNRSERKETVQALLQKTNLYDARKKNLGGYSGGMKQRFGIAQALLANPKLIIVDEPTEGLAPQVVEQVAEALVAIQQRGMSVLLVEQKLNIALRISNRVLVMGQGEIVLDGTPDALLGNVAVRREWLEV